MKANKSKGKQKRKLYLNNNSIQKKDRIINVIMLAVVFSVAVAILL